MIFLFSLGPGGQEAGLGQFPWQIQIFRLKKGQGDRLFFQCGGTILTERVVVTAAHCFKSRKASDYKVILGKHVSDPARACHEQRFDVKKFSIHPDYNTRTLSSDIALMWIESEYKQGIHFTMVRSRSQ